MLVLMSQLLGAPVLSMRASARVAHIVAPIIDPDSLKIVAFYLGGQKAGTMLDTRSVREYSQYGIVIDDEDEFVTAGDVVKIDKILALRFSLHGLKVETKKGTKLGRVYDFTLTSDNFSVQQLIVHRPFLKAFTDPDLTIPRREIVEITDTKVIVKDEEDTIRAHAEKEDFIPNFVNPFRNSKPAHTRDRN